MQTGIHLLEHSLEPGRSAQYSRFAHHNLRFDLSCVWQQHGCQVTAANILTQRGSNIRLESLSQRLVKRRERIMQRTQFIQRGEALPVSVQSNNEGPRCSGRTNPGKQLLLIR